MDGSEPGDTVAAAVLSGAPTDLQARTVRYRFRFTSVTRRFLTILLGFTSLRSLQRSPVPGTAITGEWTGTFCRKVTVGRTL
jgi:hypothetical protein